jgi:hypothetical protein
VHSSLTEWLGITRVIPVDLVKRAASEAGVDQADDQGLNPAVEELAPSHRNFAGLTQGRDQVPLQLIGHAIWKVRVDAHDPVESNASVSGQSGARVSAGDAELEDVGHIVNDDVQGIPGLSCASPAYTLPAQDAIGPRSAVVPPATADPMPLSNAQPRRFQEDRVQFSKSRPECGL